VAEPRRGLSVHPLIVDLGRDYRGGQHQALLLLRGMLARGHAPELIAIQDSLVARRAMDAGISVHGVSPGRRRLAAALQIRRLVRRRQVDIVHANEPHALSSAWLARAHRSVPVITARRIALPLSPGFISLARYRAASRIVAVSHFVEKSVIESGLPQACVEVIYDGVEIPSEIPLADRQIARAQFAIPKESPCIGNVGAFVPEKGQAILVRALSELRKKPGPQFSGCSLLLCGEGPEQTRLQELARQLGLHDAVRFAGHVTEIQKAFAAMDVFAFPSHEEPLGSVLLAAMAQGLPIVATGRGGIPEVVENGKNGLLVNSLDPGELATALAHLLTNSEESRRLGEAARKTIQARFSAGHMVEATLRLYEKVTGDS
jgi:glycosyltransferase involved in cell wall biosynthesis